jgi:hypothetical protein
MDALKTCFPKFEIQSNIVTTATIYITNFNHLQISFKEDINDTKGATSSGKSSSTTDVPISSSNS